MCGLVYPQILLGPYLEQTKVFWGESTHTDTDVLILGVHYGQLVNFDLIGLDTKSDILSPHRLTCIGCISLYLTLIGM